MELEEYKLLYDLEEKHWLYMGLRHLLISRVRQYFKNGNKISILDAGCGTGYNLKCLEKYGASTGVDINNNALAYCRKRGINRISRASVSELPFREESFDLVISADVLYHRAVQDDLTAIKEIYRVLKKGGVLMVNLPAHNYLKRPHDERVHTRQRYSRDELSQKLMKNKFKIIKISYRNALSYPVLLLSNLINKSFPLPIDTGLSLMPKPVNFIMYSYLKVENAFLRIMNFPFGVSIFCLARK
jgi:ubiquinone/menaquinone biosynthesis C-methylase UbiE